MIARTPTDSTSRTTPTAGRAHSLTRVVLALLLATAAALVCSAAPALAAAPTIESESVSSVKAGEARLEGVVNPNDLLSECEFKYGTEPLLAAGTTTALCEPASFAAVFGGQGVGLNVGGLEEHTTYYYRVVATNATGTGAGAIEHFTTAFRPEAPEAKPAIPVTASEATLQGVLNPASERESEPGGVEFRYRRSASECQGGAPGEELAVGPGKAPEGHKAEKVEAKIGELLPDRQYTFCVITTNNAGEASAPSAPVTLTTLGQAPTVEGESAPEVSLANASVEAQVNPGGLPTTYSVEYGTSTAYSSSTPATSVGGAPGPVGVAVQLSGLQPGTLYHYRFVAGNTLGTVTDSEDATFTTSTPAPARETSSCPNEASRQGPSAALPDCRAYEQVTPVNKGGAEELFSPFNGGSASEGNPSEDGNEFLLDTTTSLGATGTASENTYLFKRGAGGWTTTSSAAPGLGIQSLADELFSTTSFAEVGVRDRVAAQGGEPSTERPIANLVGPPGGPYTTVNTSRGEAEDAVMAGGSSDLSHVVLESKDHDLAPGDSGQDTGTDALYEWAGGAPGQFSLVNVETDGSLVSLCGAVLGLGEQDGGEHNAVSSDGSKVFFTAPDPRSPERGPGCWEPETTPEGNPPQLYMRLDGTRTVELSAPDPGVGGAESPQAAVWSGASEDGSKVFFLSRRELTAQDTGHELQLYEYDTLTSTLRLVSRGDPGSTLGQVGLVAAISSDGSAVYFVDGGKLTPNAPAGDGLYRYDTNSETTSYVTMFNPAEYNADEIGQWAPRVTGSNAPAIGVNWSTTADGQYLAFASTEDITGYDSAEASGSRCESLHKFGELNGRCSEIYLYSAPDDTLVCVSCDPGGAAPVSDAEFSRSALQADDPAGAPPRAVSEDGGYVFFDSKDALVPQAISGVLHVYEWHDGVVSLISPGGDPSPSFFLGSSADGSNVFFGTKSQLVAQDADRAGDLYDARIDGGFGGLATPACTGTGCQGVPGAPPIFATPASVTFAGIGNFANEPSRHKKTVTKKAGRCKKGFAKRKNRCVKEKKSKRAGKSAHTDRRASR